MQLFILIILSVFLPLTSLELYRRYQSTISAIIKNMKRRLKEIRVIQLILA